MSKLVKNAEHKAMRFDFGHNSLVYVSFLNPPHLKSTRQLSVTIRFTPSASLWNKFIDVSIERLFYYKQKNNTDKIHQNKNLRINLLLFSCTSFNLRSQFE